MKYCTKCGKPNEDDNRFCKYCGNPFKILGEFPGADTYVVGKDMVFPQGNAGEPTRILPPQQEEEWGKTQPLPVSPPQSAGEPTRILPSQQEEESGKTQPLSALPPQNGDSISGGVFSIHFTPAPSSQPQSQGQPQQVSPAVAPPVEGKEMPFQPEKETAKPSQNKKRGKLVAMLCAGLVVLAGLGTGAWFLFFSGGESSQPLEEALSLGERYMEELDYGNAVEAYNEAIRIDPKNKQAYLGLAQAYSGSGEYDQAEVAYRELLNLDASNAEAYRELAEMYIRLDQLEKAKSLLEQAVQQTDSEELQQLYAETTPKAPTFSLDGGSYSQYQEVAIASENGDSIIYYTTDGSEPTADSPVYTEPIILISGRTQLKAAVVSSQGYQSDTTSAEYTITVTPTEVEFADPVIKDAVRNELGLEYGERITTDHTAQVRELSIVGDFSLPTQSAETPLFTEDQYQVNYSTYSTQGNLTTLSDLSQMPFLQRLHLAWQKELDMSGLASASRLEELSLIHVGMITLEPVASLTGLKKLNVSWNRITDLTPVSGLTALTSLNVWGNQISDISPVSNLKALTYLDFSRNQVQDISGVSGLESLESLWMYDNQVSDLSPLEGLEKLRVLMIRDNPIEDLTALKNIFPRLGRTDTDIRGEETE